MNEETDEEMKGGESAAGPIVHRGNGTSHHLSIVDIDRSDERLWVVRGYAEGLCPCVRAEQVTLEWEGGRRLAVLSHALLDGSGGCLAAIAFHPGWDVLCDAAPG